MNFSLIVFVLFLAFILAKLEIQIEGKDGWAKNLPTWKVNNPFRNVINWPYITGYHLYLWLFIILAFHTSLFFGLKFSFKIELSILATIFLVLILEDFMWFVINPRWGIKKFFKEEIPWHSKKIIFLPKNYWIALFVLGFVEIFVAVL